MLIKYRVWNGKEMSYPLEDLYLLDQRGGVFELGSDGEVWLHSFKALLLTGILDKDGKDIYDGDVVEIELPSDPLSNENMGLMGNPESSTNLPRTSRWLVKWHEGAVGFVLEDSQGHVAYRGQLHYPTTILGNIHENPELMPGKDGDKDAEESGS